MTFTSSPFTMFVLVCVCVRVYSIVIEKLRCCVHTWWEACGVFDAVAVKTLTDTVTV